MVLLKCFQRQQTLFHKWMQFKVVSYVYNTKHSSESSHVVLTNIVSKDHFTELKFMPESVTIPRITAVYLQWHIFAQNYCLSRIAVCVIINIPTSVSAVKVSVISLHYACSFNSTVMQWETVSHIASRFYRPLLFEWNWNPFLNHCNAFWALLIYKEHHSSSNFTVM